MINRWFSYDPDAGFSTHATETEAFNESEAAVQSLSDEMIHEEIGDVCYGVIIGSAVCVSERIDPSGEYDVIQRWELKEDPERVVELRAEVERWRGIADALGHDFRAAVAERSRLAELVSAIQDRLLECQSGDAYIAQSELVKIIKKHGLTGAPLVNTWRAKYNEVMGRFLDAHEAAEAFAEAMEAQCKLREEPEPYGPWNQ